MIGRLHALCDGTFAVALTLLVLELRLPADGGAILDTLAPQALAYAGTFAVVSFFWLAHMSYMRRVAVFDWATAVLSLLLLFWIALTPFASSALGESGVSLGAWLVYAGVMIGGSLSQTALWLVVSRGGGRLLAGGVDWRERAYRTLRALSPAIAFAVSLWALSTGRAMLAVWSTLLFVPVMLLAGLLFGWRHPRPA